MLMQDTSATTWSSRAAPVACLSLYLSARLVAYTAMAPAHSAAAALTDTLTSSLSDTAAVTAAAGGFAVPEGLAFAMLVYTLVVSSTPSISASHELIHSKVPAHGLLAEAFLVMGFIHPFYRWVVLIKCTHKVHSITHVLRLHDLHRIMTKCLMLTWHSNLYVIANLHWLPVLFLLALEVAPSGAHRVGTC